MKKIELDDKQTAYKLVIEKVLRNEISTKQAALELCLTQRCIEYKVAAYKRLGDRSFIHANFGKKHENDKYKLLRQKIVFIFLNTKINGMTLWGVSYAYFKDLLEERFGIEVSVSYVKKVLRTDCNYNSPRTSKRTDKVIHFSRSRKEKTGEIIEKSLKNIC